MSTELIKELDQLLGQYYASKQRNDYFDKAGKGKLLLFGKKLDRQQIMEYPDDFCRSIISSALEKNDDEFPCFTDRQMGCSAYFEFTVYALPKGVAVCVYRETVFIANRSAPKLEKDQFALREFSEKSTLKNSQIATTICCPRSPWWTRFTFISGESTTSCSILSGSNSFSLSLYVPGIFRP